MDLIEYLKYNKNYWIIDIETDDFNASVIWCVVVRNIESNEVGVFFNEDDFNDWYMGLPEEPIFIGHNLLAFDIPILNRLWGIGIPLASCIDTLILSYLYQPNMPGGHSLGAWGERLKQPKAEFSDFSKYSQEMLDYCIQDTNVNRTLYLRLTQRMVSRGFSNLSCWVEHNFAEIINEQQRRGFAFDIEKARNLHHTLQQRQRDLGVQILRLFPDELRPVATYENRVRSDGTPYASRLRHNARYTRLDENDDGTYTCYDWVSFNINSPSQRVAKLLSLGWKPTKFTPKTEKGGGNNPKIDEDALVEFATSSGIVEVGAIAEYLVLQGRITMIAGWIKNYNEETGAIHGRIFSCGAGTRRCTHNNPNTANIPKAEERVPYGWQCRELWIARPGRRLVGADAKSCQARIFGHYLNNDEVARRYYDPETFGDPHQVHADAFGDSTKRSPAKNVFFAFIFGAQPPKLGATWGTNKNDGKRIQALLFERNPGLKGLIDNVKRQWKTNAGRIRCIDGGWVLCPAEHAALNYLIQSAEKIQMAVSAIYLRKWIKRYNLDAYWVGNIHDEWQIDCAVQDAERVGQLACKAMRVSGRFLKFRVPMDGDYRIGRNWAETH